MKVILFGATGNLGQAIAKELVHSGHDLTVVIRNERKAKLFDGITSNYIVADVSNKETLKGICTNQEAVISALGKSVSPNDKSKPSFRNIDLNGNLAILSEAKSAGVKKFVYVSAFKAEEYLHLEYFKVHHEFSEHLKKSGINYSIVKPPAIFSAYGDVIEMAKKGRVVNIGKGEHKTNPIYEGDLAKVCVAALHQENNEISAGGKSIYTRGELNSIVQNLVDPSKKVRNVPVGMLKVMLPIMKVFNKNSYDKFAFFVEVMQHDTIAPQVGEMTFEEYIQRKVTNN